MCRLTVFGWSVRQDARQDRVAARAGDASDATPEVAATPGCSMTLVTMRWRRILGDDDAPAAAKRALKLPR